METNYRLVGKVKESHGLKGDFYVLIFSGDISWLPELKAARFVYKNESGDDLEKEVSIQKVKPFKNGFILKTHEVSDRSEADKFRGALFYISDSHLTSKTGETIYLTEIEGFDLFNKDSELIGKVVGFSSNGAQDILVIKKIDGKEVEVPFVAEFIKNIDFDKSKIKMDLPEGLLDLDSDSDSDSDSDVE